MFLTDSIFNGADILFVIVALAIVWAVYKVSERRALIRKRKACAHENVSLIFNEAEQRYTHRLRCNLCGSKNVSI